MISGLYGSEAFVGQWLPKYLQTNYGPEYPSMKPYGVIVMDTMMEFNTSANSQVIPNEASGVVSSPLIVKKIHKIII